MASAKSVNILSPIRITAKLTGVIPTGDYANIQPSYEVSYEIPAGADPVKEISQLQDRMLNELYAPVANLVKGKKR